MDAQHLVSFGLLLLCCLFCKPTYGLQTYYMEDVCNTYSPTHTVYVSSSAYGGLDSSGIIKATRSMVYKSNFTCIIHLVPSSNNAIIFAMRKIDLRFRCIDKLTLTGGFDFIQIKKEYCEDYSDTEETETFTSFGTSWSVNFTTSSSNAKTYSGFELTYTAYKDYFKDGPCADSEYQCKNLNCISKALRCDGHNHCGDKSDGTACGTNGDDSGSGSGSNHEKENSNAGYTAAWIVSILLMIGGVAGAIYVYSKRLVSTRTTIHPPPQQPYTIGYSPPEAIYPLQENQPPQRNYLPQENHPTQGNYATQEKYPRQEKFQPQENYPPPPPYAP